MDLSIGRITDRISNKPTNKIQDSLANSSINVTISDTPVTDYAQMIWLAMQNKAEGEKGVKLVSKPESILSGYARANMGAYNPQGESVKQEETVLNFSAKA